MNSLVEIRIPDVGDFKDIPVIELLVKPGDTVEKETSLITLETDKAAMEIPSPQAGVVNKIHVKIGDKVSQGSLILTLEAEARPAEDEARAVRSVGATGATVPAESAEPVKRSVSAAPESDSAQEPEVAVTAAPSPHLFPLSRAISTRRWWCWVLVQVATRPHFVLPTWAKKWY